VLHVVAQVVTVGHHVVEEGPILAVRCQYELGHLLIGAQVHARSADPLKSNSSLLVQDSSDWQIIDCFDQPEEWGKDRGTGIAGRRRFVHP